MGKKIIIFSFTEQGSKQNKRVRRHLLRKGYACESYAVERYAEVFGLQPMPENLQEWIGEKWGEETFLFIGAAGIAVRMIAPWVKDKYSDSAVLVMDEQGIYVIPLLSGHIGGGVRLAGAIAGCTYATPIITTATDVEGKFAADVFAKDNGLKITDRETAKQISAAVLDGETIGLYCEYPVEGTVPDEVALCRSLDGLTQYTYGIIITESVRKIKNQWKEKNQGQAAPENASKLLFLPVQPYVVGIGCRKGISLETLSLALERVCGENHLEPQAVCAFASIDLKKEEEAILRLADIYHVPFQTYSAEALSEVETVSAGSAFVESVTGVDNVCERAAKRYCPEGNVVVPKQKLQQVTLAIVKKAIQIRFTDS